MWNMGRVKIVVWVGLNCDVRFMSCLELYWVASSFVELHQLRWAVWILVVSFSWTLVRHWVKCFRSCYLNRWFCSNNKILSCFVANTVLGNVKKPKVGGGWVAVHCDVKSSYWRLWKYSFDLLVLAFSIWRMILISNQVPLHIQKWCCVCVFLFIKLIEGWSAGDIIVQRKSELRELKNNVKQGAGMVELLWELILPSSLFPLMENLLLSNAERGGNQNTLKGATLVARPNTKSLTNIRILYSAPFLLSVQWSKRENSFLQELIEVEERNLLLHRQLLQNIKLWSNALSFSAKHSSFATKQKKWSIFWSDLSNRGVIKQEKKESAAV